MRRRLLMFKRKNWKSGVAASGCCAAVAARSATARSELWARMVFDVLIDLRLLIGGQHFHRFVVRILHSVLHNLSDLGAVTGLARRVHLLLHALLRIFGDRSDLLHLIRGDLKIGSDLIGNA